MYPALKEYLSTKLLDPKDFRTAVTSYLRVQLDNIRRYYSKNSKMANLDVVDFCTNQFEPKSFCSFAVLMENIYTQVVVGMKVRREIVALYKDLKKKKLAFFPPIIYKTKYYRRQPVGKLYTELSDLLSHETTPDKHSLFVLHSHLLMLQLAESKSKHDNILVSFLQSLNPELKLTASEVNSSFSLEDCYDDEDKFIDQFIWNPLLNSSNVHCTSAMFYFSLSKISNLPVPGQTKFERNPAFYRDIYIIHEQLMYLQVFSAQKSMPNIITQLLMHDQIFELPFSSMVNAKKEINQQLNQILAEEIKPKHIFSLSFLDILQFMTRYGENTIRYLTPHGGRLRNIVMSENVVGMAHTKKITVAEELAQSYLSNSLEKKNNYYDDQSVNKRCIIPFKLALEELKTVSKGYEHFCKRAADEKVPECKQFCQDLATLKEIPKVANLSRLLHNTAHPPGYASNRGRQIKTSGPIPFCLFDKEIKGALKKLIPKKYVFDKTEASLGYNFCDEAFQSYTDSGLCTVLNVQKGSSQINNEYNAIPSHGEKQHKLHYPQTATKWIFEDGIIVVLDSWAFNGLVTKTHNSNSDPMNEYQLLQSDKLNNFKILLSEHNDIPMMLNQESNVIRLDKENELASVPSFYIKVKVEVEDADENIRTVEVKKRKCRFEDETDRLKIFSTYSKANCLYECRYQLAKEKCQCVPWNFPHKSTDELCDLFGSFCFTRQISWLSENLNDVENIGSPPCGCYPSCKSHKYIPVGKDFVQKSPKWFNADLWQNKIKLLKEDNNIVDLFNVKYHPYKQFLHHYIFDIFYGKTGTLMHQHENLGPMTFFYNKSNMPYFASANLKNFENSTDDLTDRIKNIAILYIDFDRSHYRVRRQIKRTTLANMLSSFGGILGLFLGFSVFGLLDLIFWAKKHFVRYLLRNWKPMDGFGKIKMWMTVQMSCCRRDKDNDREETYVEDCV